WLGGKIKRRRQNRLPLCRISDQRDQTRKNTDRRRNFGSSATDCRPTRVNRASAPANCPSDGVVISPEGRSRANNRVRWCQVVRAHFVNGSGRESTRDLVTRTDSGHPENISNYIVVPAVVHQSNGRSSACLRGEGAALAVCAGFPSCEKV